VVNSVEVWYEKRMNDVWFLDLWQAKCNQDPATVFPDWNPREDRIGILSPHDDDALLGAGYAILAGREMGVTVCVMVVCNGCAGYSTAEQKFSIVEIRRRETLEAYSRLGLAPEDIHRFDVPDFSAAARIPWELPGNEEGIIADLIAELRRRRVTRFFIPNGYREHLDHEAVYDLGRYASAQTGDAILVDYAEPFAVRSVHVSAVWGDFPPALAEGAPPELRGNKAVVVPQGWEEKVRDGIRAFRSQGAIIESLAKAREGRGCSEGFLELYQDLDPRPNLDYGPYVSAVNRILRGQVLKI